MNGSSMFLRKFNNFLFVFLILAFSVSNAQHIEKKEKVNILTWWGYIDRSSPEIKEIETSCNAEISSDEYYSNDEFVDRISQTDTSYDIVIFSQTVFNSVKDKIARENSDLYQISENYNPTFKKFYHNYNFSKNIAYFAISLTGFLYNPNNILITENDSVEAIFNNAGSNIIAIIDDALEANYLISSLVKTNALPDKKENKLSIYGRWEKFSELFRGKHIFITNKLQNITNKSNFAFGFIWSGEAVSLMANTNKKLKFLVHPKLSYLSSDLLATINEKSVTKCVSRKLAGKKFLDHLQNETYYFSPYFSRPETKNAYFNELYESTRQELPSLQWIDSITKEELTEIKLNWDFIKYKEEISNDSL